MGQRWSPFACVRVLFAGAGLLFCGCEKSHDFTPITMAASYQDPALLAKAWALPVALAYRQNGGLGSQRHFAFCGPATLVNVMHSFGEREVSQDNVLEKTSFHFWNAALSLSLDRLAALVREKSHRRVTVLRDLSLFEFRQHLRKSNSLARRYTINFHRGPLFGRGHGHHSPIGGYLEAEDLVLVLDVNKSYGPWLVPSDRLHAAMDTIDGDGGKKRGMLLIE